MTKKIATLLAVMLILFPKISRADLDVLSIVQDNFKVFEEKAATVLEKYKGYQVSLQELSLNRDIVSSLRDNVEQEIRQETQNIADNAKGMAIEGVREFANSRLSTVTLPGLDTSASFGPYATPELKQKTAVAYLRRSNIANDIEVNVEQEKRTNNELIENLANIYANALVTRKRIMKEMGDYNSARNLSAEEAAQAHDAYQFSIDNGESESIRNQAQHYQDVLNEATEENAMNDDDDTNNPDVNTVQFRYGQVARRANHRWLEIWNLEANYYLQLAKLYESTKRVGDIDQIIGAEEEDVDRTGMDDIGEAINAKRKKIEVSPSKLLVEGIKQVPNIKSSMKSGNIAGVFSSAGEAFGNSVNDVDEGNKIKALMAGGGAIMQGTFNNDWSGVAAGGGSVAGAVVGGNTGRIISTASIGAGNTYNNIRNNDWGGAISSAGVATGNAIGGSAGDIVAISSMGAGTVYHGVKDGDWSGVVSTSGAAIGTAIGGVAGNIVSTSATGAGNVYKGISDGNWGNVINDAGNAAGGIVGGTTGEMIGATGNIVSGGINVGVTGGNANEVFDNITGNGGIQGGLGRLGNLDTEEQPTPQGGFTPGTSTPEEDAAILNGTSNTTGGQ